MFLKPLTRAPRWILIQSFFLAIGWSYPHGLSHRFLRRLKLLWGETASQKRFFSTDNGRKSSLTIFTAFLTIQTSSQNISITLLQISLKLRLLEEKNSRERFWKEQFPVPRNTSESKIEKGVISLLWQLRCHCNPDHNKFSSLSNTTEQAIFQIFVYGDVVYAQTCEVLTLKNCIEPP